MCLSVCVGREKTEKGCREIMWIFQREPGLRKWEFQGMGKKLQRGEVVELGEEEKQRVPGFCAMTKRQAGKWLFVA